MNDDEDGHRHIKSQRGYKSRRAQDKEIYEDEDELSDPKLEIIILCQKYKSRLYIIHFFPKSTSKIDLFYRKIKDYNSEVSQRRNCWVT